MLNYKSYIGHVQFDDENDIFHGEVINIKDVVTFQGKSVKELKKAFKESIDDYLNFCKENHEEPNKPFSGKFNVRISPELHRLAAIKAKDSGESLNALVAYAIKNIVHSTDATL